MNESERFIRSLLDPERYGFAVPAEVRDEARRVLGMQPAEKLDCGDEGCELRGAIHTHEWRD